MAESLIRLLLQLSEGGEPTLLSGSAAEPFYGPGFQDLLGAKILIEQPPATEWQPCDSCECGAQSRPIRNVKGHLVALCPLDSRSDSPLDQEDLRFFEFHIGAFAVELAAASGFKAAPFEVIKGVWALGDLGGRNIFFIPSRAPAREPILISSLRASAKDAPITIVTPSLPLSHQQRFSDAQIHVVTIEDGIADDAGSFAMRLDRLHPPTAVTVRLTMDKGDKTTRLDGRVVHLAPRSFKLLLLLAETAVEGGPLASHAAIERHLWGKSVVNERAASDAIRGLRRRLEDNGIAKDVVHSLIRNRLSAGYYLELKPEEIEMIAA